MPLTAAFVYMAFIVGFNYSKFAFNQFRIRPLVPCPCDVLSLCPNQSGLLIRFGSGFRNVMERSFYFPRIVVGAFIRTFGVPSGGSFVTFVRIYDFLFSQFTFDFFGPVVFGERPRGGSSGFIKSDPLQSTTRTRNLTIIGLNRPHSAGIE